MVSNYCTAVDNVRFFSFLQIQFLFARRDVSYWYYFECESSFDGWIGGSEKMAVASGVNVLSNNIAVVAWNRYTKEVVLVG